MFENGLYLKLQNLQNFEIVRIPQSITFLVGRSVTILSS